MSITKKEQLNTKTYSTSTKYEPYHQFKIIHILLTTEHKRLKIS